MDTRPEKQRQNGKPKAKQNQKVDGNAKPSPIEWIVGTVSGLLTLAIIGFLFYQAIEQQDPIPQLLVTVENIRPIDDAYHAEFRILNEGDATAADVLVRGELRSDGAVVEEREVTLNYVPSHSERKGALIFQNDPRNHNLQIDPHGYNEP